MRTRFFAPFILVVSLVLVLSTSGALAEPGIAANPAAPQQQAQNVELVGQVGGDANAVAVQSAYAYVGVGPRLVILDVSDPAHPAVVGRTGVLPGAVSGVAVAGDYAYVADQDSGLRIVDISNPATPSETGFCDTPGSAYGVAVAGD